jgi:hypothetical protein
MTRRSSVAVLCVAAAAGGCLADEESEVTPVAGEADLALHDASFVGERPRPARAHGAAQAISEGPRGAFVALTPRGDAFCEGDEFCCNESCSICAPLVGGTCTLQLCEPPAELGEPCGETSCPLGEVCCDPSCGRCAVDLDACPTSPCEGVALVPCGEGWCGAGETCCNESCGICAPIGAACPLVLCDAEPVLGEPCGDTACALGEVCCDPRCGTCAPEGASCDEVAACGPLEPASSR